MCGAEYNIYAVTDKPKIYGVAAAGELPHTGGMGEPELGHKGGSLWRGNQGWN